MDRHQKDKDVNEIISFQLFCMSNYFNDKDCLRLCMCDYQQCHKSLQEQLPNNKTNRL